MKILITGGTGMVGMDLVNELMRQEHFILSLHRFSSRARLMKHETWGDVLNFGELVKTLRLFRPDVVCHLAAISTNTYANQYPLETFQVNALGTVNMVEACLDLRECPLFILASSSEVYGGSEGEPLNELTPLEATMPYAAAKIAAEYYVRQSGLAYVIMRPFNTYGRARIGQARAVIDKAIVSALIRGTIDLWNPEPKRDFMFRSDHVDAYLAVIKSNIAGETFTFGTGVATSIGDTLEIIAQETGASIESRPYERRGDIPGLCADSAKALRELGWQAKVSLEEGVSRAIEEWKARLRVGTGHTEPSLKQPAL
ncbi:MAG: GDP-mannose 4,6-dehydratase [Candidatus Brocadiales bacterium]